MPDKSKYRRKGYYNADEFDQRLFRKVKQQLDLGNDVLIKSAPDGKYKLFKNKYELI